MFLGQFKHTIDEKGRLTLPAKFRPDLEAGLVVTLGLDGCLYVFPRAKFMELAARIEAQPLTNTAVRSFGRQLFTSADDSQLDRQGRVLIPAYLRSEAHLDEEVMVTGMFSRIELWNPAQWAEVHAKTTRQSAEIADQLSALGLGI
jgi:MraZ protein